MADRISAVSRAGDMVVRWGGDEFLVLLAATPEQGAEQLAERIRAAIGTASIDTRCGPVAVTVSVGVSSGDGSNPV